MLYKPKVNSLSFLHEAKHSVRLRLASGLEHNNVLQVILSFQAENFQVHVFWFTSVVDGTHVTL